MSAPLQIEVVYARADEQALITLTVDAGTRVESAIEASGIAAKFPDDDLDSCAVGIWGREVARDTMLRNGDRIEIYRPLLIDPMEARRHRAKAQATVPDRDESR